MTRVSTRCRACLLGISMPLLLPLGSWAGSFGGSAEDRVRHPSSYDGSGTTLSLSFCLDPKTAPVEAGPGLQAALASWNAPAGTTGNIKPALGVPGDRLDFESAALRGIGLCLGLDDPSDSVGYARAARGGNGVFDRDAGSDGVPGTADDGRGDDLSWVWYRLADNSPFLETPTADASTMARDAGVLPEGDLFPAVATREVALVSGFVGTEAVMVNALQPGEAKRSLTWDDVATLKYARSGLDETAGTADDYTVALTYAGLTDTCDVLVVFEPQEGLVACPGFLSAFEAPNGRHEKATLLGFMAFNDQVQWHFGVLFNDGFETGDTTRWSSTSP